MEEQQKKLWLKYAKRFRLKSIKEVEQMEELLEQQYDYRKFYIQDIGKNEYWSVKEK